AAAAGGGPEVPQPRVVRLGRRARPLRAGGRPPAGRGPRVRAVAEAVGGGADVRLAEALPAAERGPGEVHPVVPGHDPPGDDPPEAPPALPGRQGARVSLPRGRVEPTCRMVT